MFCGVVIVYKSIQLKSQFNDIAFGKHLSSHDYRFYSSVVHSLTVLGCILYESESDVTSDLLHCFQFVCLYYSDSSSDKDQRKKSLSRSL